MRYELNPVDRAYGILQNHKEPMFFRELLLRAADDSGIQADDARRLAHLYTQINLDPRFSYQTEGMWGLREWEAGSGGVQLTGSYLSERNYEPRRADYDWDEDTDEEADDESELLVPGEGFEEGEEPAEEEEIEEGDEDEAPEEDDFDDEDGSGM
jgi:DNA-directed RNA polymerase subunit delta